MMKRLGVILILLVQWLALAGEPSANKMPPLWGYGVNSCDAYVAAWNGREEGIDEHIGEYRRFEDWLTGLVSGLNLATGQDVLVGVTIDSAMRRIHLYCDDHRKDDFFTAAMDLVRMLSQLK
jgi:hypothetical protein